MRTVDVTAGFIAIADRRAAMRIAVHDVDPATVLENVEMRAGEVTEAEPFPAAERRRYRLEVEFGAETRGWPRI